MKARRQMREAECVLPFISFIPALITFSLVHLEVDLGVTTAYTSILLTAALFTQHSRVSYNCIWELLLVDSLDWRLPSLPSLISLHHLISTGCL